ncbi:hypothetical protein B0J14DRAFT_686121 [Halenospora varia]|nr:hypothetical protein B0J14DRAFT_686121 [Halenospora varia]
MAVVIHWYKRETIFTRAARQKTISPKEKEQNLQKKLAGIAAKNAAKTASKVAKSTPSIAKPESTPQEPKQSAITKLSTLANLSSDEDERMPHFHKWLKLQPDADPPPFRPLTSSASPGVGFPLPDNIFLATKAALEHVEALKARYDEERKARSKKRTYTRKQRSRQARLRREIAVLKEQHEFKKEKRIWLANQASRDEFYDHHNINYSEDYDGDEDLNENEDLLYDLKEMKRSTGAVCNSIGYAEVDEGVTSMALRGLGYHKWEYLMQQITSPGL